MPNATARIQTAHDLHALFDRQLFDLLIAEGVPSPFHGEAISVYIFGNGTVSIKGDWAAHRRWEHLKVITRIAERINPFQKSGWIPVNGQTKLELPAEPLSFHERMEAQGRVLAWILPEELEQLLRTRDQDDLR